MNFKVERLKKNELKEIVELDRMCFDERIVFDRDTFRDLLSNESCVNLAIRKRIDGSDKKKKEKLVAFAIGLVRDVRDSNGKVRYEKEGIVLTIDVHPEMRRLGLGSALMNSLEKEFVSRGCKYSVLTVQVNNHAAISLYEKLGYKTLHIIPGYYPTNEDAYLMLKII
ncbi:MAG: N-acetyltransferase [Thermoplasmata archaeon]